MSCTRASERRMVGTLGGRLAPHKAMHEFVRLLRQQKRMHDPLRATAPPSALISDLYAVIDRFTGNVPPRSGREDDTRRLSPLDVAGHVQHPSDKDVMQCNDGTILIHDLSVLSGTAPCLARQCTPHSGATNVGMSHAGAPQAGAPQAGVSHVGAPQASTVDWVVLFVGPVGHVQAVVLDMRPVVRDSVVLADVFDADGGQVSAAIKHTIQEKVQRQVSWLDVNANDLQRQRSGADTLLCAHLAIVYVWLRLVDGMAPLDALSVLENAGLQDDGAVPFGALISRVRDGQRVAQVCPPNLLFRPAGSVSDAAIAAVLEADRECWELCNRCYDRWSAKDIDKWCHGEGRETVVAYLACASPSRAEEAVGYVLMEHRADCLFIFFLCCADAYRRRGVGRACLHFVFSVARSARHSRVDLCVHARNKPAIALYESEGFSRVSARSSGLRMYSRAIGNLFEDRHLHELVVT